MEKPVMVAALLLVLLPLASGQAGFQSDLKELSVGENDTVNVTVENPLPIDDVLAVRFNGEAITAGLVDISFPEGYNCNEAQRWCRISVDAESQDYLPLELTGTAIGQEPLTAKVNSTTTQLSNEDVIEIRTHPNFAPVTVSAPGIQLLQFLLLGLAGALVFRWKEGI